MASCCRGNSEKASELYEACIKAATQEDLAGDLTIKAGTRSFHSGSFPNRGNFDWIRTLNLLRSGVLRSLEIDIILGERFGDLIS
jgi:hypothetical protein